jgi:hypothetical protein
MSTLLALYVPIKTKHPRTNGLRVFCFMPDSGVPLAGQAVLYRYYAFYRLHQLIGRSSCVLMPGKTINRTTYVRLFCMRSY